MKRTKSWRLTAFALAAILALASTHSYAEQASAGRGSLRHEAFLRGGSAIAEALSEKPIVPLNSALVVPPDMPAPLPAPQASEGKHHRVMLWVGLAVTGVIAGYLIQKAVRDHGKIFSPQN